MRKTTIIFSRLLFFVIIVGLCASCVSKTKDEKIQKSLIRDTLLEIERAFNNKDLDGIMKYYHPDFLHNGAILLDQKWEWQSRFNAYTLIEFDIRDIQINNDEAIVWMTINYYDRVNSTPALTVIEPETIGDLSYFYHTTRQWTILGNQYR